MLFSNNSLMTYSSGSSGSGDDFFMEIIESVIPPNYTIKNISPPNNNPKKKKKKKTSHTTYYSNDFDFTQKFIKHKDRQFQNGFGLDKKNTFRAEYGKYQVTTRKPGHIHTEYFIEEM